ncbi:hypothetical protein AAEO56_04970 [Flavobacterium sp. DGU11]|uniref:Outer membrane protein beta-barrel domain-containing protein n=1 Tax=Flavobacterium arundinis TaxID=3139143 RepID=A0ABU9HTV4_9FLAO
MLKKILLLAVVLCLNSCATIFTRKEYKLKVFSYEKNRKAIINDSTYMLPAEVKVRRSKEDLKVTLISGDTLRKDFIVKASPNPAFLYGNLIFMQAFPVGYAVDLTTQKRFYYGRNLRLDSKSTDSIIEPPFLKFWNVYLSKKYTTPKGQWAFTASMPYANAFYQQPKNEPSKSKVGFLGFSAGLEYYYKEDTFVKLNASATIDFEFPIPVPLEYFDAHEKMGAYNFTLTHNHKFNRLSFGYGFNYAINTWKIVNSGWKFPSNDEQPRIKRSHSFGVTANTYYQFSDNWSVGLIYSPTFYNTFPKSGTTYQHVISLDIMYRLPFKF